MVAKTKSNLRPTDEPELPFEIEGADDDAVYESILAAMKTIHDKYVKDNLRRFAQDENRHKHFKLLPFWLIGWGDAHKYLDPIHELAALRTGELLGKEFEDMKLKAAYIRGVKKFIKDLYSVYGGGPVELKDVNRKNLASVIGIACAAEGFYDVYDANINEFLAWDDQTRIRIAEQSRNRLAKLL